MKIYAKVLIYKKFAQLIFFISYIDFSIEDIQQIGNQVTDWLNLTLRKSNHILHILKEWNNLNVTHLQCVFQEQILTLIKWLGITSYWITTIKTKQLKVTRV